jgi:hypothetical protein
MKDCPKCRLANPDNAIRCDCGYDFASNTMEQSYLPAKERRVWTFEPLLVLSLAVAVLGAVLPFAYKYEPGLTTSWIASVCLALFWLILVVVGLLKFKKRGLWLLIGAPIALFFPFSLVMMLWACAHNRFACP